MTETPGWLARMSKSSALSVSALLLAACALIDWVTGTELRAFVLYWPAIALVAWHLGTRWGMGAVAVSTAVWTAVNWSAMPAKVSPIGMAWNVFANATSFAVLAWVTARLRAMGERERAMALEDFVTGVGNARAFMDALGRESERAWRTGAPTSVAYLDVDNFKAVNDRFGHSTGDAVLRGVAEVIESSLRASDLVARVGGDEFAILLPTTASDEAERVIRRVKAALDTFVEHDGWALTFSFGIVTCPPGRMCSEKLLTGADAAMYEVKRAGKDGVHVTEVASDSGIHPPAP